MTVGDLIVDYRRTHGLSQRQFANRCGLSNGYISMIERGENPNTGEPLMPTLPVLRKISIGLGVSLDTLLSKADDIPISTSAGKNKEPIPEIEDGLDKELIDRLCQLTPAEIQRVDDFVKGLLAAR